MVLPGTSIVRFTVGQKLMWKSGVGANHLAARVVVTIPDRIASEVRIVEILSKGESNEIGSEELIVVLNSELSLLEENKNVRSAAKILAH